MFFEKVKGTSLLFAKTLHEKEINRIERRCASIALSIPLDLLMICMFELRYDTFESLKESLNNQKTQTTRKHSSRMPNSHQQAECTSEATNR